VSVIAGIAEERLDAMAAHAAAVVDRVLATQRTSAVRADDLEDIRSTVLLRLLTRMRRNAEPIENFETFVSTATYNAINDHLRRRYPERARLKNRLRYLLMHDGELALWHGQAGLLCGMRREMGGTSPTGVTPRPGELSQQVLGRREEKAALLAIFARAGGSLALDDVMAILVEVWNVVETRSADPELLPFVGADAELALEQRRDLAALWGELLLLPPPQRTAVLLNLRDEDGGNALALVLLLGVASFDEAAAAAGLTPERLAELWSSLPLDDNSIAVQLGVSRQQVINLRSSGRRRLVRRMDARGGRRS
jgi:DNA-directed RNA polymerase specialized sigma24 family protein